MTLHLIIDTDVLIKCACYAMLDHVQPPSTAENGMSAADSEMDTAENQTGAVRDGTGVADNIGILGAARFVVRHHLERRGKINDRSAAQQRFEDYLRTVAILEPTDEELTLASAIEDAGQRLSLDLDVGESQLCAIAVFRLTPYLLTGDKRAIIGAELLQEELVMLSELRGRIICLEQALIDIAGRIGMLEARLRVCAEPGVDKSLTICFECSSGNARTDFGVDGLESYVRSLREQACTLLYEPQGT